MKKEKKNKQELVVINKKNKKENKIVVVNFAGGPGTGKSIIASDLFSALKREFITCDLSSEYIKRKLREKAQKVVQNQIYIFAKQQFQLFGLKDEVQVAITDSPLFFSAVYDETDCPYLRGLIIKEFKKYHNLTYLVKRNDKVPYEQEGRYQDKKGAEEVDKKMIKFLKKNKIKYKELNGIGEDSLKKVVKDVKKAIKNTKRK